MVNCFIMNSLFFSLKYNRNLRNAIRRLLIFLKSVCCSLEEVPYKPQSKNKDSVLIVINHGMGDFVIIAYYYDCLYRHYMAEEKEVKFLTNRFNMEFIRVYFPEWVPDCIVTENDLYALQDGNSIDEYRNKFDVVLLPGLAFDFRDSRLIRIISPRFVYSLSVLEGVNNFVREDISALKAVTHIKTTALFYPDKMREFCKVITNRDFGFCIKTPPTTKVLQHKLDHYFVIYASASTFHKVMPINDMIDVARRLEKATQYKALFLGDATADIVDLLTENEFNVTFINRKNFQELIELLNNSAFIVTADTGPSHIAAALGKVTFIISPLSMREFMPYPNEYDNVYYLSKPNAECKLCNKGFRCFLNSTRGQIMPCLQELSATYIALFIIDAIKRDNTREEKHNVDCTAK